MSVFFGLICAGIAIFIFISLVINGFKSRNVRANKRVRRPSVSTLSNVSVADLESEGNNEITHDEFNNIFDFKETQDPMMPTRGDFEDSTEFAISDDHSNIDDDIANDLREIHIADLHDNTNNLEHDAVHTGEICEKHSSKVYFSENLITLFVLAKPNQSFEGYGLYQTLIDEGLIFGDMDIFHYYVDIDPAKTRHVFSIAQATEPGTFNLDSFGAKAYQGICLLMNLDVSVECEENFELMLEKSYNIAKSLNGSVCDQDKKLLSNIALENCYDKIFDQKAVN